MLELSIFSILALFMLGGSITMVWSHQPLFSAFGFLIAMLALAGLFGLLNLQFLALAQIMVAVGAVVVLTMLTILSVNAQEKQLPQEPHKLRWFIISTVIVAPFTYLLYATLSQAYTHFMPLEKVTVKVIGKSLFSEWVFAFEIISILLLTAMVGAIVIARKHLPKQKACS